MRSIEKQGSVRVDLLGGTIDLPPINVVLPQVVTLNVATSLKAKVKILEVSNENFNTDKAGVLFVSKDYNEEKFFKKEDFTPKGLSSGVFKQFEFVARLLAHFSVVSSVQVELSSGSPPGAGLGGSSAMGVTLFSALSEFVSRPVKSDEDKRRAVRQTQGIESIILNKGPAGYQDYYPALYGGILALKSSPGEVEVEQMFSLKRKDFLESHLTLVYSGNTRLSGINNWEVYKAFFDNNEATRNGLAKIAEYSYQAYQALKDNQSSEFVSLIIKEGIEREKLFPNILTPSMSALGLEVKNQFKNAGVKVCGAGGGGCFLIAHAPEDRKEIALLVQKAGMQILDFRVASPV